MNITLSADPDLIRRARAAAAQRGVSLNELIREYFREVADSQTARRDAVERFFGAPLGHSGGDLGRRDDAYHGRT